MGSRPAVSDRVGMEVHGTGGLIFALCLRDVMHVQHERQKFKIKMRSRSIEHPVETVK